MDLLQDFHMTVQELIDALQNEVADNSATESLPVRVLDGEIVLDVRGIHVIYDHAEKREYLEIY